MIRWCVAFAAALGASAVLAARDRAALPSSVPDDEFWTMTEEFSEPNGFFNSDNLLSNETTFQYPIPRLVAAIKPGMAYLGVGPEQNFTYIIALQPGIAFIPDIRRGNLQEHLLYKALIEMAADRAEFLSLLFSRARPAGLGPATAVGPLLDAYMQAAPSDALYQKNFAAVKSWLIAHHGFKLRAEDVNGIDYIYSSFQAGGPLLSYNAARPQRQRYPTYSELQRETDGQGQPRGYLASEANFRWLKRFEELNLIIPIVGDFGGSKALKAVAGYLKDHGATVGAFYTSNVENYLFQDGIWAQFARNAAALPLDASSTFIRACFDSCAAVAPAGSRAVTLLDSMTSLLADVERGRVRSYWDVLQHGR